KRRDRAVVARVRELGHVSRLRTPRRRVCARRQGACVMSAASLTFARSNARPRRFAFDPVLLATTACLLLLGLAMMTSASIAIADRQVHEPLHYLERQAMGVVLGLVAALIAMAIPSNVWERLAIPLLMLAFLFLVIVLIPGIGHEVNGSRRWLRF